MSKDNETRRLKSERSKRSTGKSQLCDGQVDDLKRCTNDRTGREGSTDFQTGNEKWDWAAHVTLTASPDMESKNADNRKMTQKLKRKKTNDVLLGRFSGP
jgi:hypothetical protein